MPDTQIHPTGTLAVPADYPIPGSAELLLKNAYAHFDGSGAAGSYLPLLRIISDAGSKVVEAVADTTIAAGASADASWFPRVAAAASSAGFAASWIIGYQAGIAVPSRTSPKTSVDLTGATTYTNDATTFTISASTGLKITKVGFYLAFVQAQSVTANPQTAEVIWQLDAFGNVLHDIRDSATNISADTASLQATKGFAVDPGSVNTAAPILLEQVNTGASGATFSLMFAVARLTADYGTF